MQEISVYAPVIIPTLCRYEHFRRCVESLSQCTHADKTELIIGLDYPLKEEHWNGYRKISDYVNTISGFSKVTVLRTNHNLGFGPNGNSARLKEYVKSKYDRYIFSEDDNEFSPCFLDFIDKALERYMDDDRVSTICGFNQYTVENSDVIFIYDNSVWGMACWLNKKRPVTADAKRNLKRFGNIIKLFNSYPRHLSTLINMIRLNKNWGDANWTCDNIINEHFQLRPSVSLVRNWGNDGTGQHCNPTKIYESMHISRAATFDFSFPEPNRTKVLDESMRHNRMPQRKLQFLWAKMKIAVKALKYYFLG